ncbi:N-acetylmuramoyl-L-alanine amidase [Streptomyces sp. WMMC500]|uniref:N-acetylmuramoyl-L-alanine amidase n=1 Tax=Streptomyces sp. WMMC500 TaxID=3015154 RepID=UPI00248BC2AB|nr:N-acetylmuramoyl-L-alanine amidase [Streptomyces sp. WMMC500]WBB63588.1 N-acetylmuramoyl-L-alanine amidase [Streptomyces sp. WMMC500]
MSPRRSHAYRPLSLRRRAWLTLGAVVLGGAGVVTVAVADPGSGSADPAAGLEPRKPAVHGIDLAGDGARQEVDRTSTERFSMVGVSWSNERRDLGGAAEVRTRSAETGAWSGWRTLDTEAGSAADDLTAGMRGGTEPLWVGPSDGVEARVVRADGTSTPLPAGMEVALVDPGVTQEEAEEAEAAGVGTAAGTETAPVAQAAGAVPGGPESAPGSSAYAADMAPAAAVTQADPGPAPDSPVTPPPVIRRAAWGADESLAKPPTYNPDGIKAAFVHHTAEAVNYTCAQSAAMVRSIFLYHVGTNGWDDVGYNFFVDKCGRIFEGAAGGIDQPVLGAHTKHFNSHSTGIAVLGDYHTHSHPSQPALEAVARIAAWKLGQYDVSPTGSTSLTPLKLDADDNFVPAGDPKTIKNISGHKDGRFRPFGAAEDVNVTACPGDRLYPKLGHVRALAAAPGASHALPTRDVNGDGRGDLVAGVPRANGGGQTGSGAVFVVPGGENGPVASAKRSITQNSAGVPGTAAAGDAWGTDTEWGDVNNDGIADLLVGAPNKNDATGHADAGVITVLYGPGLDSGRNLVLGDGFHPTGAKFGSAVAAGDFDGDGRDEVLGVGAEAWATHDLNGNGREGSFPYEKVAYQDAAVGDFNRDGYDDAAITYRDPSGKARLDVLRGTSVGLDVTANLGVPGGRSVATGDVTGDGYADLVVGQPFVGESAANAGGQVTLLKGGANGLTTAGKQIVHQATGSVPGASEAGDAMGFSVAVGDVDANGYADVLAGVYREDMTRDGANRADAGTSLLLRGGSGGLSTASGSPKAYHQDTTGISGVSEKGDRLGSSAVLADLSGYGRADVVIGVIGEDAYDGTLLQLDSGSQGVSASGAVYYGKSALGTPTAGRLGIELAP